ncbi:OmpA family protein [Paracoccus aminophilus]|nr:OmpA family protein [Paracoccus aminophilus]
MARPLPLLTISTVIISLAACAPLDRTAPNHTTQGTIAGGVAGALIGGTKSGSSRVAARGALIGATAGSVVGSLADQQRALRQSINDPNVQISNDGTNLTVVFADSVLFDTSSFTISPNGKRDLFGLAAHLQRFPQSVVRVIGHTDSTGSLSYNQTLSERRAAGVANTLIAGGVSAHRITTLGQGPARPIASNANPAGRAENRRVEIVILPAG